MYDEERQDRHRGAKSNSSFALGGGPVAMQDHVVVLLAAAALRAARITVAVPSYWKAGRASRQRGWRPVMGRTVFCRGKSCTETPPRRRLGSQRTTFESAIKPQERRVQRISDHHPHSVEEVFHLRRTIMQLEYDAPGLFWIKKSHAYSILIFGPPNNSDPFLLHLSDGRIELRSIYGVSRSARYLPRGSPGTSQRSETKLARTTR